MEKKEPLLIPPCFDIPNAISELQVLKINGIWKAFAGKEDVTERAGLIDPVTKMMISVHEYGEKYIG